MKVGDQMKLRRPDGRSRHGVGIVTAIHDGSCSYPKCNNDRCVEFRTESPHSKLPVTLSVEAEDLEPVRSGEQ